MSNVLSSFSDEITRAVDAVQPYVVSLSGRRHFYASGVLWRPGVIVTAEHAIREADEVPVILGDGSAAAATIAGRDGGTDLAVLRIEHQGASAPPRAAREARPGTVVITVGRAPEIGALAAMGIVSGVRSNWRTWRGGMIHQYIRLDVAMYPGSSGAAVVDTGGGIIGIATPALSRAAGVAIPNVTIDRVVDEILAKGHVKRAWLGLGLQPVSVPERLAEGGRTGVMIVSLEEGGPAEKSGLLPGDIVLRIGGRETRETSDVQDALEGRAGENVAFEILRGGEARKVDVAVGERKRRK